MRNLPLTAGRVLAAALLTVTVAACGSSTSNDSGAADRPTATTTTTVATTEATVWLVDGNGHLVAVTRQVEGPATARNAIDALVQGPTADEAAKGLTTAIPKGTKVLGLDVDGTTATVDLSSAFTTGGGSASIRARAAQVVFSVLDQFATVEGVSFQVEGQPVQTLGGEGLVVDRPLTRADFADLAPAQ